MSYGNGQQRRFLLSGTTGSFTNVMQKDLTGGCLITRRRSQDSRWRPVIDHRPSPRWTRATRRHLAKKFVPPGRCSPQERDLSKATQFSRAGAQWSTYVSAIILVSVAGYKRTPVFPPAKPLPGQVVIDPEYPAWLKREGGSHLFICGPGDPEDFLYRGRRNPDGTRAGDQMALIDKLVQYGGNCIYMQIVRSHGGDAGDDSTQNSFIDSDPKKGLGERILAQVCRPARVKSYGIVATSLRSD